MATDSGPPRGLEDSANPVGVPLYQWVLHTLGAVLSGLIGLGALLGSINDARALVSWKVTIVGSVALMVLWIAAEALICWRGLRWTDKHGQPLKLRRVRAITRAQLLGFVILLWIPRFIDLLVPQPPTTPQETKAVGRRGDHKRINLSTGHRRNRKPLPRTATGASDRPRMRSISMSR
jgi:hypothetical protein